MIAAATMLLSALAANPVVLTVVAEDVDLVLTLEARQQKEKAAITARLTTGTGLVRAVSLDGPASVGRDPLEFLAAPARGGRLLTLTGLGPVELPVAPRADRPAVLGDDDLRVFVSDDVFRTGVGDARVFSRSGQAAGFAVTGRAVGAMRGPGQAGPLPAPHWLSVSSACGGQVPRAGITPDRSRIVLSAPVCFADFAVARVTMTPAGRRPQVALVEVPYAPGAK